MLKMLKQARAAFGMLNPEEVRKRAETADPCRAGGGQRIRLLPRWRTSWSRRAAARRPHRAHGAGAPRGRPNAPAQVDIVLYQPGLDVPEGAYSSDRDDPERPIAEILQRARRRRAGAGAPVSRVPQAGGRTHHHVGGARERAVRDRDGAAQHRAEHDRAAVGVRRVRVATPRSSRPTRSAWRFRSPPRAGKDIGFSNQKVAVVSIVGGAFGWRALARELAGKIPLGEGLIPKGAIAFAGTYVVGKGLQRFADGGRSTPGMRASPLTSEAPRASGKDSSRQSLYRTRRKLNAAAARHTIVR